MHPRAMLAMVRKDALDIWLDWSKFSTLLTPLFLAGIWLLISYLAGSDQPTPTMLLVSRGSLGDMLLGKVLVALVYQLVLSVSTVALLGGFGGNAPLLLLYILLGACLGLGLLLGVLFQTASAANAVSGVCIFSFLLPAVIVPLTRLSPAIPLPTGSKCCHPTILPMGRTTRSSRRVIQQQPARWRRDPGDHPGRGPAHRVDASPSDVCGRDHLARGQTASDSKANRAPCCIAVAANSSA